MRFSGTRRPPDDQWWEWGPILHAVNSGKRGITLDLARQEGIDVFHRLLAIGRRPRRELHAPGHGPVRAEWDSVHELNPQLIMVRMPAFGLDGPWRDRTGFAQTMESVSGMAWRTGFEDGPPTSSAARATRSPACTPSSPSSWR